mmetsp:Transcript_61476/g.115703  ORF Transcript_61476/g.115703 Transcript_61476/m.115703 type:complete len:91 (-) Transcript_61476:141-413(-)
MLVDAKAKLDLVDANGKSALIWAAKQGHVEVVKILVDAEANLDLLSKNGIMSALRLVAKIIQSVGGSPFRVMAMFSLVSKVGGLGWQRVI